MTKTKALEKLATLEKTTFALGHAVGLMYYDGATVAPRGSAGIRGSTMGELSRLIYTLATSEETKEMLKTLMEEAESLDAVTAKKVSELHRDHERVGRIPVEEYVAAQELAAKSETVWREAKEKNDFSLFEPCLQEMFDVSKKMALYMEPEKKPYDTALDMFERNLNVETCDIFFCTLRQKLVPLIKKVAENSRAVDDAPLKQNFPLEGQRRLSEFIMDSMGLDRTHCVLGETEHPFTTNFSKNDVRLTTHYYEDAMFSSLYSVIHEGGHALYELHIGDDITFTNIGGGASMAMHESQSRFYENIIGRSREFCGVIFPWLQKEFAPRFDTVSPENFYRMMNKSAPSLIRIEADELTYSLHVMVRYELEKRMFSGELTAKDLPSEWNRLYKEYLGVDVPDDRRGVLQDSHWSGGNIGYFPSYAIGSAYGAQYIGEINKDLDLKKEIASGNLKNINAWFEKKIWRHGRFYDPVELFESVCGKFNPDAYVHYLENKFGEIYG